MKYRKNTAYTSVTVIVTATDLQSRQVATLTQNNLVTESDQNENASPLYASP